MKKNLAAGILLFTASLAFWGCSDDDDAVQPLTVSIGDTYEGGIVFYIAEDKLSGLVAAPQDQGSEIVWSAKRKVIPTEKEIGTGLANTIFIVEAKKGDTEEFAAKAAYDLVLGGYDDWYLPSINELEELYKQRAIVGLNEAGTYWSSSAIDGGYPNAGYTYNLTVKTGKSQTDMNQHSGYAVRAVRTIKAK